jgi:hypothetical protein
VEEWGKRLTVQPAIMKSILRRGVSIAQEKTPAENGVTPEMLEPLPRVSQHCSYLYSNLHKLEALNTIHGRREAASDLLRAGYCYSLPLWSRNMSSLEEQRCRHFDVLNTTSSLNVRGEWKFEMKKLYWLESNRTGVILAHAESMARNPLHHDWDDSAEELESLFPGAVDLAK